MTQGSAPLVLVVDDDQPTREVLRTILEDAGYTVQEAPGAEAALNILRASTARVTVLFDHIMPGMDGLEALRHVVADPRLATTHSYILITADVRPLGPDDVNVLTTLRCPLVRKPFDLDTLLGVVGQQVALLQGPPAP
jgi:CheY-like chemotaxis protein